MIRVTPTYYTAADGGFVAIDGITRVTAYAYPSSEHAALAARGNPALAAVTMLRAEIPARFRLPRHLAEDAARRDDARIAAIPAA